MRAQGGDPFRPYDVDFFFDLPDQAACEQLGALLKARDFAVDFRQVDADRGDRYTLHAFKALRISVPDMQALTVEFKELASAPRGALRRLGRGRHDAPATTLGRGQVR